MSSDLIRITNNYKISAPAIFLFPTPPPLNSDTLYYIHNLPTRYAPCLLAVIYATQHIPLLAQSLVKRTHFLGTLL